MIVPTELRTYMKSQGVDLDRDVLDRLTDTGMRSL